MCQPVWLGIGSSVSRPKWRFTILNYMERGDIFVSCQHNCMFVAIANHAICTKRISPV